MKKEKIHIESIDERKFINYITKYFIGIRNEFIKNNIQYTHELDNDDIQKIAAEYSPTISIYNPNNWIDDIENKKLYMLVESLSGTKRKIIYKVLIQGNSLTNVANELGISKQLAYAYKKQFLNEARKFYP